MSKPNSKAFNTFTQKLKKHNKEAQADIDRYKKVILRSPQLNVQPGGRDAGLQEGRLV